MTTSHHLTIIASDMERQARVLELEASTQDDYWINNELREISQSQAHDAIRLRNLVMHWPAEIE
jgi:hypothetical protein